MKERKNGNEMMIWRRFFDFYFPHYIMVPPFHQDHDWWLIIFHRVFFSLALCLKWIANGAEKEKNKIGKVSITRVFNFARYCTHYSFFIFQFMVIYLYLQRVDTYYFCATLALSSTSIIFWFLSRSDFHGSIDGVQEQKNAEKKI